MLELLGGGILGSLLGGVFRLAPEVLKWLDKGSERKHELAMFKEQCALETMRGEIRFKEIGASREAAVDTLAMGAFNAAIQQQTELVKAAGGGWIASFSASVRPIVTYSVLGVWAFVHCYLAVTSELNTEDTFRLMMTQDFTALVSGTLNYWFIDRTLTKRGL